MLLSQDHTSLGGILALTVCVTAAAGYQQAPLRGAAKGAEEGMSQEVPDVPSAEADGEDGEEEQEADGHDRASSGSGVSIEMHGRASRV